MRSVACFRQRQNSKRPRLSAGRGGKGSPASSTARDGSLKPRDIVSDFHRRAEQDVRTRLKANRLIISQLQSFPKKSFSIGRTEDDIRELWHFFAVEAMAWSIR
mmetsp:Transcript_15030/g.37860  ORF Transcript_15030/g.37860 Transcript_15030/m.37860 type:complete len:104 (-) Transcript_15030:1012-1323(-)